MSRKLSSFMLVYGGVLSVDDNFFHHIRGEKNRSIQVPSSLSLDEFKLRIAGSLKFRTSKYMVSLVCRHPIGTSYVASDVHDEEVYEVALRQATEQMLMLYVNPEPILSDIFEISQVSNDNYNQSLNVKISTKEVINEALQ